MSTDSGFKVLTRGTSSPSMLLMGVSLFASRTRSLSPLRPFLEIHFERTDLGGTLFDCSISMAAREDRSQYKLPRMI